MSKTTWIIIGFLVWFLFFRQPQPTTPRLGIAVGDDRGWLSKVDSIVGNVRGLFGGASTDKGAGGGYGTQPDGSYTIPGYEDQGTATGDPSVDAGGGTT